jgi:hypothetical protein
MNAEMGAAIITNLTRCFQGPSCHSAIDWPLSLRTGHHGGQSLILLKTLWFTAAPPESTVRIEKAQQAERPRNAVVGRWIEFLVEIVNEVS